MAATWSVSNGDGSICRTGLATPAAAMDLACRWADEHGDDFEIRPEGDDSGDDRFGTYGLACAHCVREGSARRCSHGRREGKR